jgi:hypothetical protein
MSGVDMTWVTRAVALAEENAAAGSLDQVAGDFRELIAMGAQYVVLDTNPDHPRHRLPAADDMRALAAIAERLRA